jgi:hypothetical protein
MMGDRVLIQLRMKNEVSPALYLHWGGGGAYQLIRRAERVMRSRGPDLSYAFARLVGEACREGEGNNTGVGVHNAPKSLEPHDSNGDAGCLLVDLLASGWVITPLEGYYARDPRRVEAAEREARKGDDNAERMD